MAKNSKVSLTRDQAEEMYYQINSYYLFLQCAENVDKTMFGRLKFWNPSMNNHLRRARESMAALLREFHQHFRPIDHDTVKYDAPAELYRAMEYFSRLHPDRISEVMDALEKQKVLTN